MVSRKMFSLLLVIGFAVLLPQSVLAADKPPVKCLMVGMEPHGEPGIWKDVLTDIKDNYPSVNITPVEKDQIEQMRYENLVNYDVLMIVQMQVENGNPPDFVKEGILQFMKDGGGLVINHFAVANVQNWRDSIDIFGAMWVSGKSTHGPYHTFRVDMVDETHPIVDGVRPFVTDDELYFNLLMRPDMHVIMAADEERFGHTVAEPMLCTHYVHNARCVYFALGHDVVSCRPPEFRQIVVQSIEWAACRR